LILQFRCNVRSHTNEAYFAKFAAVSGLHVSLTTPDKGIFDKLLIKVGIKGKRGTSPFSSGRLALLQSDKL